MKNKKGLMEMKKLVCVALLLALSGCGAPLAPEPSGERIPVNVQIRDKANATETQVSSEAGNLSEAVGRNFRFGYEELQEAPSKE